MASTSVVLDVESGSAGGLLLRSSPEGSCVAAHRRFDIDTDIRESAHSLLARTRKSIDQLLSELSHAAARLRQHAKSTGTDENDPPVSKVSVLVHAPWSHVTTHGDNTHKAHVPREFSDGLRQAVRTYFEDVPVTFHSSAQAAAHVSQGIFSDSEPYTVAIVTSEMTEFVTGQTGAVLARSTQPIGHLFAVRTLATHGGLSYPQALSALRVEAPHLTEASAAAADRLAEVFRDGLADTAAPRRAQHLLVISHEPHAAWLAQRLADSPIMEGLLADDATVRTLGARQLSHTIGSDGRGLDVFLALAGAYHVAAHHDEVY